MKTIVVPPLEMWNDELSQFEYGPEGQFVFEHSLYAISQWEAKYKKSFFVSISSGMPGTEFLDYITFGVVEGDKTLVKWMSEDNIEELKNYMSDPCSASTVNTREKAQASRGQGGQFMTSELLYSYLVGLQIPFEVQYWNLNRMLMLIKMCNQNNKPKEKMSKKDNASSMAALNRARRAKSGSKG
jgi:hypothetical protein